MVPKDPVEFEKWRKKISDTLKGHPVSEETRKKMSDASLGRPVSEETRRKRSVAMSGEKHPFFGYRCIECGAPQNGRKLHIHHVNFNKKTCCDNSIPLFVPLCGSCHGKTQTNRPFWEYWFTEMINRIYDGKCYFTKEEMETYDV